MIYIFDVDGTLTPKRGLIDPNFKTFFQAFIKKNRVWLISGSDRDKTIGQVGFDIWGSVERCYQNSGNQLYINDELKYQYEFKLPVQCEGLLEMFLGNVRRAQDDFEKALASYEKSLGIIGKYELNVESSIDMHEKGRDKGQIVKDIKGKFEYFGDRFYPGGNDFPIEQQILAQKRKDCKTHSVESWKDTKKILKNLI